MKNSALAKPTRHSAPPHLKPATKRWWREIVATFEFEEHHLRILRLACEAYDRAQEARAIIDKEGLTYVDRFGAPRARPEVNMERDARISFARLVRELGLDTAGTPEAPRAPRTN